MPIGRKEERMSNSLSLVDLRANLENMAPEDKAEALALLAKIGIDLSKSRADLTGTGIAAFLLENKIHAADSHKDVFVKLTQLLIRKHPEKIDSLFRIQGRTKKYFSKSPSDFKHGYEQIKGTEIFVDTNENASQLNRRCQKVMQAFGVDPTLFIVIPK
jgi:negative regulator of replication initiation